MGNLLEAITRDSVLGSFIRSRYPLAFQSKTSFASLALLFLFSLGSAASVYYLLKTLCKVGRWFRDLVQSLWNSKKYLSSECEPGSREERYYAVIYGAGNKAGKIFA